MTFIVTLIALLIERFFDWSHLRKWRWYIVYQHKVAKRFPKLSAYFLLALTILPLLIIIGLIEYCMDDWLYGFAKLLFELLIVLYCLGPKNLWADAFSCITALTQGDKQIAADKLKITFGMTEADADQSLNHRLLNNIFIAANRRVFSLVFWYVALGIVGALLYRTITLSAMDKEETAPDISSGARWIEAVLEWIPVRIFTFIFALTGHFVHVLSCWRRKVLLGLSSNETLLTECGIAALSNDGDHAKIVEDGSIERAGVHLLDRSFVIVLVIVAILAWVN